MRLLISWFICAGLSLAFAAKPASPLNDSSKEGQCLYGLSAPRLSRLHQQGFESRPLRYLLFNGTVVEVRNTCHVMGQANRLLKLKRDSFGYHLRVAKRHLWRKLRIPIKCHGKKLSCLEPTLHAQSKLFPKDFGNHFARLLPELREKSSRWISKELLAETTLHARVRRAVVSPSKQQRENDSSKASKASFAGIVSANFLVIGLAILFCAGKAKKKGGGKEQPEIDISEVINPYSMDDGEQTPAPGATNSAPAYEGISEMVNSPNPRAPDSSEDRRPAPTPIDKTLSMASRGICSAPSQTTVCLPAGAVIHSSYKDDDDDDEPPPLLPPKTVEAEQLYGTGGLPAISSMTARPEEVIETCKIGTSRSCSLQPTVHSYKGGDDDDEDDDEPPPVVPPKTLESEQLYESNDQVKAAREASKKLNNEVEYTDIEFQAAPTRKAPRPAALKQNAVSDYADIAF